MTAPIVFDTAFIDDQRQRVNGQFFGPVRWQIFALLWQRMGKWVARSSIVQIVPRYFETPGTVKSVSVHICLIRKALAGTPYKIETQHGMGYRMVTQ
jgi:DNA-binding response OmpR family regulator